MVCTTIRPTKLCYADTSSWQGVAAFVADYFDFEPLTKPMLHVSNSYEYYNNKKEIISTLSLLRRHDSNIVYRIHTHTFCEHLRRSFNRPIDGAGINKTFRTNLVDIT